MKPASATNAKPKKVHIVTGASSRTLRAGGPLDRRTAAYKLERAYVVQVTAHLGGDPTVPQARLIDHAARLRLIAQIAWGELMRTGAFRNGQPVPALDAFRRVIADERAVLQLIGIERHQFEITDVAAEVARQRREEDER
jgi:hypothetical protein